MQCIEVNVHRRRERSEWTSYGCSAHSCSRRQLLGPVLAISSVQDGVRVLEPLHPLQRKGHVSRRLWRRQDQAPSRHGRQLLWPAMETSRYRRWILELSNSYSGPDMFLTCRSQPDGTLRLMIVARTGDSSQMWTVAPIRKISEPGF